MELIICFLQGLDGKAETISVKSRKYNGYISHKGIENTSNSYIYLSRDDGSSKFKDRASFYHRKNRYFDQFSSLEASTHSGYYFRHLGLELVLHKEEEADERYKMDASFVFSKVNISLNETQPWVKLKIIIDQRIS